MIFSLKRKELSQSDEVVARASRFTNHFDLLNTYVTRKRHLSSDSRFRIGIGIGGDRNRSEAQRNRGSEKGQFGSVGESQDSDLEALRK
ncbi:unnamed protein product [Arabidopsis halleri]